MRIELVHSRQHASSLMNIIPPETSPSCAVTQLQCLREHYRCKSGTHHMHVVGEDSNIKQCSPRLHSNTHTLETVLSALLGAGRWRAEVRSHSSLCVRVRSRTSVLRCTRAPYKCTRSHTPQGSMHLCVCVSAGVCLCGAEHPFFARWGNADRSAGEATSAALPNPHSRCPPSRLGAHGAQSLTASRSVLCSSEPRRTCPTDRARACSSKGVHMYSWCSGKSFTPRRSV